MGESERERERERDGELVGLFFLFGEGKR